MSIKVITTNDIEKEVWTYLELFSIKDYTRNKLFEIHKNLTSDELREKSLLINSCINQAKEYYTAAKSVTMLTKPLLLYYGMYSLAKALIFLNNPKINLDILKHHGLKVIKISDDPEEFLNTNVKIHKIGIFHHLIKYTLTNRCVISGKEIKTLSTSTISFPFNSCFSKLDRERLFNLRELFMSIPELFEIFRSLEIQNFNLLKIHIDLQKNISNNYSRILAINTTGNKTITPEFLYSKFPELNKEKEYYEIESREEYLVFKRSQHGNFDTLIPKRLVQSLSQELFLILMDKPISNINLHFMIMFLLGYIVRYKPPLWLEVLKTTYKSIIDKFIISSERKFPHIILNELLKTNYHFVSA